MSSRHKRSLGGHIFQFVAVIIALACAVSAQLVSDWNSNPDADLDSEYELAVMKVGTVGRNILFRRTSTRFEKLEQTTEALAKNLNGINYQIILD